MRHGDQLLVLMEHLPARKICLAVGAGTVLPLSRTNSGKLILSSLDPEELAAFLERDPFYQSTSAKAKSAFRKGLPEIAKAGQVIAPSGITGGVRDYARAVGIPGTDTAAVLAVSQVLTEGTAAPDCAAALARAAEGINRRLGALGV